MSDDESISSDLEGPSRIILVLSAAFCFAVREAAVWVKVFSINPEFSILKC